MKIKSTIYLAVIAAIAILSFFSIRAYLYAKQPEYKTFKSNVTFQYPKSWTVKTGCKSNYPFIGTRTIVKGDFKGSNKASLVLHGEMATKRDAGCVNDNPRLVINTIDGCKEISTAKHLKNDLYVALNTLNNDGLTGAPVSRNRVTSIFVLDKCGRILFDFNFVKNNGESVSSSDDLLRYQEAGVNKDDLVKSAAYKEIVKFAESINLYD